MDSNDTPGPHLPDSEIFADLAQILYLRDNEDDIYDAICRAAPLLVQGCDHAGLMLKRGERFVTVAASDEVATHVGNLEREVGNGPCIDAIENEGARVDSDITANCQWPDLAKRVIDETPVRGMMGFRLLIDERKSGALNLFSDTAGALTESSHNESAILTSFAAVTLLAHASQRSTETMLDGLESNREIGKAVGLMMVFHKVSDVEAFAILSRTSQDMNIRLAEVAHKLVTHHNDGMNPLDT